MAVIAFVGDSFCATYGFDRIVQQRKRHKFQYGATDPTHPELVADALRYDLYPCGYGSKGWWFSRQRLLDEITATGQEPEIIVFFHTNSIRINNAWNADLNNVENNGPAEDYYKYIFDQQFNEWAQQQWFKEIATRWAGIKTIHFNCFTDDLHSSLLPGMVYATPLIYISVGELTGTDKEIDQQLRNDRRHNHLNTRNNIVLSEIILAAINDYCPGRYELDLGRFELINPNSIKYPFPGHGTK
jgi:hypothetical protein